MNSSWFHCKLQNHTISVNFPRLFAKISIYKYKQRHTHTIGVVWETMNGIPPKTINNTPAALYTNATHLFYKCPSVLTCDFEFLFVFVSKMNCVMIYRSSLFINYLYVNRYRFINCKRRILTIDIQYNYFVIRWC